MPWVSKIPVLGALFRHETKSHKKTNLLIFLRPVIVRDASTLQSIAADRYGNMQMRSDAYKTDNWLEKDDTVPALPRLDGPNQNVQGDVVDLTRIHRPDASTQGDAR